MLSFGQRLKAIRKDAQLTQAELAEKLMVSVQAVSKWECDNAMPDISQIVPLCAILGVTTDCLLGVGGDEASDKKRLLEEVQRITKGIENVYSRKDDAYYACYTLYKEHMQKYPLDYEVKFLCADCLTRFIYYGSDTKEGKDRLYNEAENLLKSIINYDRDTTRLIDAKQILIILYLYQNEFARAEEVAQGLPQRGSIRASMEIEIYSKKNDHEKCLEISDQVCEEAVHHYLWALAVKARRISLLGNSGKTEAIAAWRALLDAVKWNYKVFHDITIKTKWLYSALNNLANDYIAISDTDKAFEIIEELTDTLIDDYKEYMDKGNKAEAEKLKDNFRLYLHSCYNWNFPTDDNIIANDPRFRKCERLLNGIS